MYEMPRYLDLKVELLRPEQFGFTFLMPKTDKRKRYVAKFSSEPLFQLIDATAKGECVQELKLIKRPGDIWDYVWIKHLEGLEPELADRLDRKREGFNQTQIGKLNPWPEDCVPVSEFESLLIWTDEFAQHFYKAYVSKTERVGVYDDSFDSAWLVARFPSLLTAYSRMHFHHVLIAKAALDLDYSATDNIYRSPDSIKDIFSTMSRQQVIVANRLIDKNKLQCLT